MERAQADPPAPSPPSPRIAGNAHAATVERDGAFALLDALFANAPVGLAFWDTDLRYRRINAALAAINGLTPEQHLGRSLTEVLGGELGSEVAGVFRRILDTGEPMLDVEMTGETRAAPGERRQWVASYYPVRDGGGRTLGIGAVVLEVTVEREASAKAREALSRAHTASSLLDAVFSAAPVGIGFYTPELRYERVNDALAALNGRSVAEHVGRTTEEVLGELGAQVTPLLREVLERGEPVLDRELVGSFPHGPGTGHVRSVSFFPVLGPAGEIIGIGGVTRDVTATYAAEVERGQLMREALTARAQAEAAQVRAEAAREEAERARAGAEAERRRTAFLARASAQLAESMDYETTLRQVARTAVPAVADWCAVTMVERGGELATMAAAHTDPVREAAAWEILRRYPSRPEDEHGAPRVIRTGRTEFVADIPDEVLVAVAHDGDHLRLLRELGLRSAVTVPLTAANRTLGALTLFSAESDRRFGPEDVALAEALGGRAALAVLNARLYTERSHIAQTLQRSLLPARLPAIPGVEVAARYRPAGEQNEVGGDFYDVFPAGDHDWVALIGDVAGKGPEAAAITSLTRHTLRTAALREASGPDNLRLLNQALLAQADAATQFCTVVYARVLPGADGAEVVVSNGGHPPPLVLRADGRVESVAVPGTLVGVVSDPLFEEERVRLGPGELILFYTDGVTELRPSDPAFGDGLLHRTLAAGAGRSADEVVAAIEAAVVSLQNDEQRDDIALLALRVDPGARVEEGAVTPTMPA